MQSEDVWLIQALHSKMPSNPIIWCHTLISPAVQAASDSIQATEMEANDLNWFAVLQEG